MSNVEAVDNDVDNDLIFISEEHIDLEDSSTFKQDHNDDENEETSAKRKEKTTDEGNIADEAELEHAQETGEQEDEEQELDESEEKLEDKAVGKDEGLMVVDEWGDEETDSEPDNEGKEIDEDALNPEDIERSLLNMPTLNSLLDDMGYLKQNRRLVIQPLDMSELENPKIKEVIADDACEEVKVHFVRSKSDAKKWTGIAILNFMTKGSAGQAMEAIKQMKEDINIKVETNTSNVTEHYARDNKSVKRWTDNVLIVRNLIDNIKLESLKELFPDAEEVVIHKETAAKHNRESTIARGFAYLMYRTDELAAKAAQEYKEKKLMLEGHRLSVLPYRLPTETIPRGLLRLRERKLVMKHLDKLSRTIEKAEGDPSVKVPENATQRITKCKELIEKDDKTRKDLNLMTPSWEELKHLNGLPTVAPADSHRLLVRLGILEEKKKETDETRSGYRRDPSKNPARRTGGGFDRNAQRSQRRGASPRNTRRSPQRKRNWIQHGGRNQRTMGVGNAMRNSSLGGGMINPLALMMQQGIMGSGAVLNPGLMMQPNMGAALLGAGGLMGGVQQQNMQFLGPMASGHGLDEPSTKMIRLDETGNFRSTDDRRFHERDHHAEGHHYQQRPRDRDERSSFRGGNGYEERRHRSRSPVDRSAARGIGPRSDSRGYSEHLAGGRGASSSTRAGNDSEISSPVNLLLNLSQILSQKMEQKRQQVERERRSYDRGDYHGGQR